jgi:hypothetical protein
MRLLLACCFAMMTWAQAPAEIDLGQQVAAAEATSEELARQWIKDPRPVYKAWAAQVIRQHEWQGLFTADLIDALGDLSHLDAPGSAPEIDEDRARLSILDALIQGRVSVARNVSLALLSRYPAQAMILLYERGCPAVMVGTQILDGAKSDEAWLVAAQCLAGEKGGAIELLQRHQIAAVVKVFDPNRGEQTEGFPGGVGIAGDAIVGGPSFSLAPAVSLRFEFARRRVAQGRSISYLLLTRHYRGGRSRHSWRPERVHAPDSERQARRGPRVSASGFASVAGAPLDNPRTISLGSRSLRGRSAAPVCRTRIAAGSAPYLNA